MGMADQTENCLLQVIENWFGPGNEARCYATLFACFTQNYKPSTRQSFRHPTRAHTSEFVPIGNRRITVSILNFSVEWDTAWVDEWQARGQDF